MKGEVRHTQKTTEHKQTTTSTINKKTHASLKYKDNYFEEIAIAYLKSTISYDNWNRTSDTEPGHDGCLCIYFDGHTTEWWMEAKYSLTPNNLSRGRLDATIIEVLLNHSKFIERLFVVTNCDISAKIKADIKTVVINNSKCINVEFITKDMLELWLIDNYAEYEKYFQNPVPKKDLVLSSDLFIIRDLEIYDTMSVHLLQQEPSKILYPHRKYNLYFSVYTKKTTEIKIKSNHFIFDYDSIILKEGINECTLPAILSVTEGMCNKMLEIKLDPFEHSKSIFCRTTYRIDILDKQKDVVFTEAQHNCLETIKNKINDENTRFGLFTVQGESGMGKTFLSDFIFDIIPNNNLVEFETFTDDPYINAKYILRTILYLYFPYAYGDSISNSIKQVIRNNFNSGMFLFKLTEIDIPNQPELLLSLFRESSDLYLFPCLSRSCRQYIIWDNFSKLDNGLKRFAISFIKQLCVHNENIIFILIQNENIYELSAISEDEFFIKITDEDIKNILNIKSNIIPISKYFPDLLTVYDLKNFLKEYDLSINNFRDFLANYIKFMHEGNSFKFIEGKIFNLSIDESAILNRIYYAYSGISINDFSNEFDEKKLHRAIYNLMSSRLIKCNSEHKLVPYHDIYLNVYKRKYAFNPSTLKLVAAKSEEETLKNRLMSLNDKNANLFCNAVKDILAKQRFASVYFILEDLITYKDSIINQIGSDTYFQLEYYRIYADANVKMSGISAYFQFSNLWTSLKNIRLTFKNYILKLYTLYELSNAAYDNFDYDSCFFYKDELEKLLLEMRKLGYEYSDNEEVEYCINQIEYMTILSSSELGLNVEYLPTENYEGQYRFLRSNCKSVEKIHSFINYAKNTLTEDNLAIDNKNYLKSDFDITFLETVINRNTSQWYERLMDKRAKFNGINHNYYIKATFSIISVLLTCEIFCTAEEMFNTIILYNNKNPRMEFFYLQLLAAIKCYNEDYDEACEILAKQYELCKNIKTYEEIVNHNLQIVKNRAFNLTFRFGISKEDLLSNSFLLDVRCFY